MKTSNLLASQSFADHTKKCNIALVIILLLVSTCNFQAYAGSDTLKLCSPKNGDHFEVTKPMLFWRRVPGVKSYSIFLDDVKLDNIKASALPVINYGIKNPLSPGMHHWYIAVGKNKKSEVYSFTIDPSLNWPAWAIGPFVRYGNNPLLRPQGTTWQSRNLYNPGVLFDDGKFRMLYRGQGTPVTSRVGYAESVDGVTFINDENPVIDAIETFEKRYGCEDARLFKYKGVYYTFYTGNTPDGHIALCEATSTNGKEWKKLGPRVNGTKNGALLCDPNGSPVKINDQFVMYVGNAKYGVCYSSDLVTWGPVTWIDIKFPENWVTPYEPCVAVTDYSLVNPNNIILFVAGTLNGKGKWYYAISEVLFSKTDPARKVDQLNDCIMKPTEPYESGQFKNCLWMNCIIRHNNQWMMYYGGGDRNIGLATAPVNN